MVPDITSIYFSNGRYRCLKNFSYFGHFNILLKYEIASVELAGIEPASCSVNPKDSFTGLGNFSKLPKFTIPLF